MSKSERIRDVALSCLAIALTIAAAAAASVVQIQLVVFGLCVIAATLLRTRERALLLAVSLVPFMGLVRRLLGGKQAYVPADPLVLLPVGLVLAIVIMGWTKPARYANQLVWIKWSSGLVVASVLVTMVLRAAFSVDAIFAALSLVIPVLLIGSVLSGRTGDVWPLLQRALPILGLLAGIYGIVQFLFLPTWDRAWMVSSQLTSIGQPEPLAVRVFGSTESPGPFASLIGVALVVALCQAMLSQRVIVQVLWFGVSAALTVPLLLSGVRSALIGVVICAVVLIVLRGRGLGRILPLALILIAGALLYRVLDAVAGSSSVLTTDRYTQFDTTDNSLQARLNLLQYVVRPFGFLVGSPSGGHLDNLSIDVLVLYGIAAGVGVTALFVAVVVLALRNIWRKKGEAAAIAAIFVAVMSVSGNVFISPFGLIVGVIFGSVCLTYSQTNVIASAAAMTSRIVRPRESAAPNRRT